MTSDRSRLSFVIIATASVAVIVSLLGVQPARANSLQCIGAGAGPGNRVDVCVNGGPSIPEIRRECGGSCTSIYVTEGGNVHLEITSTIGFEHTFFLGLPEDTCVASVGLTAVNRDCLVWIGP